MTNLWRHVEGLVVTVLYFRAFQTVCCGQLLYTDRFDLAKCFQPDFIE